MLTLNVIIVAMAHPLRTYRQEKGITLLEAADALDVSAATISRIENEVHGASSDLLRRIYDWSGGSLDPNTMLCIGEAKSSLAADEVRA